MRALLRADDGVALVEIGQSALYDLIEALFGGDGSSPPYREARAPSELERAVAEGLEATPPENVFVDTNEAPLRGYRVEVEE